MENLSFLQNSEAPLPTLELPPRPKGIEPQLLLTQVFNTAPFLRAIPTSQKTSLRYLELVKTVPAEASWDFFSWAEYFELCLAAHFSTVATFVPTDVDVHIRFKLWQGEVPEEDLLKMVDCVEHAFSWDTTLVSNRWLQTPQGRILEGHKGEWFSVAAAAYGASRHKFPEKARSVLALIQEEIENESKCFEEFLKEKDYFSLLKASVLVAHNLGDLQRVMEMWGLPHLMTQSLSSDTLNLAGKLNRDLMAVENHRHFPLREPRALRKESAFLLPLGPFLDSWGKMLAGHAALSLDELGTVVEALIQGWARLSGPVGYARALSGIENRFSGGIKDLLKCLPTRVAKTWTTGPLRQLCSVSEERFEAQWIKKCKSFL